MNLKKVIFPILLATSTLFVACKQELDPSDPGNLVPKTVDQDPALPAISVNGTLFHGETFGNPDSAIIITVHGGPGDDYHSMLNCKALAAEGYFVVFYDQRGTGLSPRFPKDFYTLHTMIDDLGAVIRKYRKRPEQKVFLLGHSWGAMLATSYINEHPDEINGAVLSEPGGFTWEDTKAFVARSRGLNLFSEEAGDIFYSDQFLTGKAGEHEMLDYKMQLAAASETVDGNIAGNAGPFPFWRFGSVLSSALFELAQKDGFDWTTNLHQFDTKVLFLYSALNTAYDKEHAEKVSSTYPNVQLELIKDSGHEMFYFGWDKVHPLVSTYFNTLK